MLRLSLWFCSDRLDRLSPNARDAWRYSSSVVDDRISVDIEWRFMIRSQFTFFKIAIKDSSTQRDLNGLS
jgi:hypothetical protein